MEHLDSWKDKQFIDSISDIFQPIRDEDIPVDVIKSNNNLAYHVTITKVGSEPDIYHGVELEESVLDMIEDACNRLDAQGYVYWVELSYTVKADYDDMQDAWGNRKIRFGKDNVADIRSYMNGYGWVWKVGVNIRPESNIVW